ncbi:MAG: GNAT family N-acetyltransferase [Candidatus Dormiibacterota bacterium]
MEEITSAAGLRALRPAWNEVEGAGQSVNPFLSWDWQWTWWEAFGADLDLRCLVVWEQDLALGIVPLQSAGPGSPTFVFGGGVGLSDHLGFVFRPGRADQVAAAALGHLLDAVKKAAPVTFELHYLRDASPELAALRQAAHSLDLVQDLTQEEVSPRVTLKGDFDTYLTQSLNKKDRHELRRKLRRLDSEQPGWSLVTQVELGLEPALNAFFVLLRASGPHKVEFLNPKVEDFIRAVCERFEDRGWLRLQFLQASGQLIAATCGFTVGGTWHLYNSGYEPEQAALSPGLICVAEGLRIAIDEGCQVADFLRGSEAYKYHLGAKDEPLWRLRLTTAGPTEGSS